MSEKYQNKYRSESARAQWWDYCWNGAYFITICTANRTHYFGEILDGKMNLTPTGEIADQLWYEIPNHQPNVELGAFVVMPNHIHGIIILDKPVIDGKSSVGTGQSSVVVGTGHDLSLRQSNAIKTIMPGQARYQNQGINTVSSIIGGYKSAVTKIANRNGLPNGSQTRFHDHIIRDVEEFERISDYIHDNPARWKEDTFWTD